MRDYDSWLAHGDKSNPNPYEKDEDDIDLEKEKEMEGYEEEYPEQLELDFGEHDYEEASFYFIVNQFNDLVQKHGAEQVVKALNFGVVGDLKRVLCS